MFTNMSPFYVQMCKPCPISFKHTISSTNQQKPQKKNLLRHPPLPICNSVNTVRNTERVFLHDSFTWGIVKCLPCHSVTHNSIYTYVHMYCNKYTFILLNHLKIGHRYYVTLPLNTSTYISQEERHSPM